MKYNKVQRYRGKNTIRAIYEDNMNTFDYILTEDEKVHDDYRIDYLKKHLSAIQIHKGLRIKIPYTPHS